MYTVCHFLDTAKDSQTGLVKFYVKYVGRPNISDNYGIILHKNVKKRKKKEEERIPTL